MRALPKLTSNDQETYFGSFSIPHIIALDSPSYYRAKNLLDFYLVRFSEQRFCVLAFDWMKKKNEYRHFSQGLLSATTEKPNERGTNSDCARKKLARREI